MTKLRPPISFNQAIDRIAGRIGYPAMADATGRAERTVRNWSDPDTGALPTVEDALRLDAAFLASGGGEPPMMAVHALRLELAQTGGAPAEELLSATALAVKEAGEACAALIEAGQLGATAAARILAQREVEEAIVALQDTLRKLGPARLATGPPP